MNDFEKKMEYKWIEDAAKKWKKNFDGFLKKLPDELCEFFFAYWPEMEEHRELIEPELKKLAVYPSQEAYFAYYSRRMNRNLAELTGNDVPVPKMKSKEKAETDLQKLLDDIPGLKDNEKYIQSYWNDFDESVKYENFFFGVHHKVKEVLVEFYAVGIEELEGEHIRRLDSDLYYLSACEFATQALKLKSRFEEQNENN